MFLHLFQTIVPTQPALISGPVGVVGLGKKINSVDWVGILRQTDPTDAGSADVVDTTKPNHGKNLRLIGTLFSNEPIVGERLQEGFQIRQLGFVQIQGCA